MEKEEKKRKQAEEIKKRLEDMKRKNVKMKPEPKQARLRCGLRGPPRLGKARKMEAPPQEEDPSEIMVIDTMQVCHLTCIE